MNHGREVSLVARGAWAIGLAVAAALVTSPWALAGLGGLVALSFVLSRRTDALARLVPAAAMLALFAFVLNAVAQKGTPLVPAWPWSPSIEGIALGARTAARLAVTALAFAWLVAATPPSSAADWISGGLGRAFGRGGDRAGLVALVALRFGPLLAAEGRRLARAVAHRAGRKPGLWAAPAIAVPLVLSAVRRADRLAFVLEARHFGAAQRTPPAARARAWRDWAVAAAGVLVAWGAAIAHV